MKNSKTITVKTEEENPVPVEIIAEAIVEISNSMKKIMSSKLKERAILLLIQDNCGMVGGKFKRKPISTKQIKEVLNSIASLKTAYVK